MKIAYFTDSFFPHVDGVTTYVGVVTRALIKAGHQVLVVSPRWEGVKASMVEKFVPGAKIVLVPGVRPFFYPDIKFGSLTPKTLSEVNKFKPDIIHFHTPGFMGLEATLLARILKIPLVTTFHTYYMEPEGFVTIGLKENGTISKVLQDSLWKVSETIHKPCDVVIAPTQFVEHDLRQRWKDVTIKEITGAVELSAFSKHNQRKTLRKKYGFDREILFMSVGRLSAEKHYDVLITAFSMILMKRPTARLVFVGGGAIKNELEYICRVLGIEHAVKFIGEVSYAELTSKNYYSMGDVFVTPSTWETQGLSVVEAMASGLPVVAFNYRAMPEVVGKGGILVKHLDQYGFAIAMGKLAGSSKLREEVGREAVIQSKKYNISKHVQKLTIMYDELIHRPATS